ncbi:MAG: ribonuclease H family protein [Fusobacteriaceae bacterium]
MEFGPKQKLLVSNIIKEIQKQPTLYFPDIRYPFQIYTDASEIGIGAILKQGNKIIGMYSKKLNKPQQNYTIIEKELYAIIKSLEHFKTII